MAESIVSSAVQLIGSLLIQEGTALLQVEDQVRSLQRELVFMKGFLQDADSKQQQREIGDLILQIRKLAYDAEDIIETYILKVEARVEQKSTARRWLLRSACFLYNSTNIYEVIKGIQAIQSSVKQATGNFITYGVQQGSELGIGGGLRPSCDEKYWRQMRVRQSYSYDDDDDYVVGWDKDISKLVQVLVDEEKSQISFLSIVGMGGSGKTTLARKLYNNPRVRKCFNCKAWVFISQEWSTRDVLSQVLKKAGGSKEVLQATMPELVEELRNMLEKKSYLVVLDDVWRREALEEILPALPRGNINKGSKVVITTRNREIIQFLVLQNNQHIYEPPPLSDEDAWVLFRKITLDHRLNNYGMESFEHLAKGMLKKCNGLPLAIVALSGILRTKGSITEWQQVNEAVRLRVMEGTATHKYGRVGDLLALSYDDLPYYLKPCFLYMGVFPEDCQIPTGMLTRMWIAEGLVTDTEGRGMCPEEVAMQRLEELSHRFMIQIARTNFKGEIKTIHLHDLLHDLSVKKAKEQSFLEIYIPLNCPLSCNVSQVSTQPRRAALHSSVILPTRVSHLRSLVMLTQSTVVHSTYAHKETLHMKVIYKNFKLLRLLNLWGIKTSNGTLPVQIGSLVHLRYLGIRASNIIELPGTIGNLRNLLTLDYRDVDFDMHHLPINITSALGKLVLLRHLFLPIESPWTQVELPLRAMKKLRILWGVKQVGGSNWISKAVVNLITTLKKLKIIVSTEKEVRNIFSCLSMLSNGLHTFHCEMTDGVALQQVDPICNHQLLHKLTLIGEVRMKLADILPSNLVMLKLKHSKLMDEDPIAAIGAMQHLKLLKLSNFYLGTTFACKSGSFPQLEELYLGNLDNLKYWCIEKGSMLCIKKLEISNCKKLKCLPKGFLYLTTLLELEYFGMPKEFGRHASELGWSPRSRLPCNYEAIIEQCDSPVNTSSVSKLCEQLTAGVFLNDKNQRYWVIKQQDDYYNCFMLYANQLFPFPLDGTFSFHPNPLEQYYSCCELIKVAESDGSLIEAAKVKKPSSLNIRFNTSYLSSKVTYEIAYMIMLPEAACVGPIPAAVCSLCLLGCTPERHEHVLDEKPRDEWLRLLAGRLKTSENSTKKFEISLTGIQPGVVIKGVIIEPVF